MTGPQCQLETLPTPTTAQNAGWAGGGLRDMWPRGEPADR